MKIIISLASLVTLAITILPKSVLKNYDPSLPNPIEALLSTRKPNINLALLPEGTVIPDQLPSEIKDPILLAAWVVLYNHTEPVPVYDGLTVTGRSLAEFARTHQIPVLWGSDAICDGSSCARRITCSDLACVANYKEQAAQPIYIKTAFKETAQKNIAYLVKVLAHELYHQALPFGPVETSLYEEYWAFYIGTQISKAGLLQFEDYNPLKAACLKRWTVVYGLDAYDSINLYPITLTADVDLNSETCTAP